MMRSYTWKVICWPCLGSLRYCVWIRSKVHDLRRSCPRVIPSLFQCEDFPKVRFWLVLELEINCRVIMAGRILLSFRGFFEEYIFTSWRNWLLIIRPSPLRCFFSNRKWQGHHVTHVVPVVFCLSLTTNMCRLDNPWPNCVVDEIEPVKCNLVPWMKIWCETYCFIIQMLVAKMKTNIKLLVTKRGKIDIYLNWCHINFLK
jgi:hypothetical protein